MRLVAASDAGSQAPRNVITEFCCCATVTPSQRNRQHGIFLPVISTKRVRLVNEQIRVLRPMNRKRFTGIVLKHVCLLLCPRLCGESADVWHRADFVALVLSKGNYFSWFCTIEDAPESRNQRLRFRILPAHRAGIQAHCYMR